MTRRQHMNRHSSNGRLLASCIQCNPSPEVSIALIAAPGTNQTFVNAYARGLPACDPATYLLPTQSPPEKFWNCADIAIRCVSSRHRQAVATPDHVIVGVLFPT